MTFLPSRLHDIRRSRNLRRYPPSHYDAPPPKDWWWLNRSSVVPRPIGSLYQHVRNLQFTTLTWLRDRTPTAVTFEDRSVLALHHARGHRPPSVALEIQPLPRTDHAAFELEDGQRYTSWYRLDRLGHVTTVTNPWPFTGNPVAQPRPGSLRGGAFDLTWSGALAVPLVPVPRPRLKPLRRCSECPREIPFAANARRLTCTGACRKRRHTRLKRLAA